MKVTRFNKWFHCFVEWEENGERCLSCIPWHIFILGWATNYNFKFVPPWKVRIGKD